MIISTKGRRKTAIARVFMKEGNGKIIVNEREINRYFPTEILKYIVNQPFTLTETVEKYDVDAKISGGGYNSQAEALRLAISRALLKVETEYRVKLKPAGLLQRDSRMVERKKPGQPKARKKFQYSKR